MLRGKVQWDWIGWSGVGRGLREIGSIEDHGYQHAARCVSSVCHREAACPMSRDAAVLCCALLCHAVLG